MEEENNAANQPEILVKFSNVQDIKGKVHSIPARIKFSGKGNIESFFVPETYTPRREIDDVYKHNKQTLERHLLSNYNLEKKEDKNQLNEELLQEANFRGRLLIGKEIELNTYDLKGIVLKESNITEDDQLNGESNTESSYLNTKYNFQRKFDCEKTFNVINYWSRDVPPTKLDRIFEWMKWPSLSAAVCILLLLVDHFKVLTENNNRYTKKLNHQLQKSKVNHPHLVNKNERTEMKKRMKSKDLRYNQIKRLK